MSRHAVLILAAALLSAPVGLAAQAAAASRPQPRALVALVAALPDSASRIVVLRRPGAEPADVILLREADATAADLAVAIAALARSRELDGEQPANALRLRVQSAALKSEPPTGLMQSLARTIHRIRDEPVRDLPGIGPARWATIPMSRFRHRRD